MRQPDLVLEKYWVTQSGYFRLATTVALGMGITDGKLLYFHGVAEVNVGKNKSTLNYRNSMVYYCFNNPFTDEFCIQNLNLPPITIDDILRPHKRSRYTPDLLPAAISAAPENYGSTLTTPSDSPDLLPSDDPTTLHDMEKDVTLLGRVNIGY